MQDVLSKEGVEVLCEFQAAVEGWGALAFAVGEVLDFSPHLMRVVISEEALYPPLIGLLGLFDASPEVGSGSALQGNVPQPEG